MTQRLNKPAEPVVNSDHALGNMGSGADETVSIVEELEKSAEDWVN